MKISCLYLRSSTDHAEPSVCSQAPDRVESVSTRDRAAFICVSPVACTAESHTLRTRLEKERKSSVPSYFRHSQGCSRLGLLLLLKSTHPKSLSSWREELPLLKQAPGVPQAFTKSILPRLTGGSPEPLVSEATMVVKGRGQEGTPEN